MSKRPSLNWSSALRNLHGDRIARPAIREDRLSVSGITAWRGQTSRRYIFSVDKLATFDADEAIGTLALFITRNADGVASISFGISDPDRVHAADAMDLARERGCTEVHINRLADADQHDFICRDLGVAVMEVVA